MFQKTIENNRMKNSDPLRLFAKLKEKRTGGKQTGEIFGVPMIQSDASDHEDNDAEHIQILRDKLQAYKEAKARQIVKMHKTTKQSIESLVHSLKDQFSYEALCIIDTKFKGSTEKKPTFLKQGGSTLPNSEDRQPERQTPGFQLQTTNSKPLRDALDLREFTLGQRDDGNTHQSLNCLNEDVQFVTEFQAGAYKSTKNIKNKIMMRRQ